MANENTKVTKFGWNSVSLYYVLRPFGLSLIFAPYNKFRGCTSENSGACVNTCSCLNHVEKVYSSRVSASKDQYCTEDHS